MSSQGYVDAFGAAQALQAIVKSCERRLADTWQAAARFAEVHI